MRSGGELDVAVVGGGLAGLATALFLRRERPDLALQVFERSRVPGGRLRTTLRDGHAIDWGPNGFLTDAPDTLTLIEMLGLGRELRRAEPAAADRFLVRDAALSPLPRSPRGFLRSQLLPLGARLRALLEPFVPRGTSEESVHAFLARRFGRGVADAFAEVLVTGVAAGDPHTLSLDALFPHLRDLERRSGSVLSGMAASQRRSRRAGEPRQLATLSGGMQRLIDALAEALRPALTLGASVTALERRERGYALQLAQGREVRAATVVLAVPAFVASALLAPHLASASQLLAAIPYAPVVVVGLGYRRDDLVAPAAGFGFLAPRGEGVRSLGVLWSSAVFPGQAPQGGVTLRAIAGGILDPGFLDLSDDEAVRAVRRDLEVTMGIGAPPRLVEVIRWPRGIPQYELGHAERLGRIEVDLERWPGVVLAGNAYRGVGVNDVVRDARGVAERLAGR